VLYQMVTGEAPPEATERVGQDGLKPPQALEPSLSAGLAQALVKGLAISAQQRQQSIREFQEALTGPAAPSSPGEPQAAAPAAAPPSLNDRAAPQSQGSHFPPGSGNDETLNLGFAALPQRTLLHGQYQIVRALSQGGGSGVTYLAVDACHKARVVVQEYLPRTLAERDAGHCAVKARSGEDGEFFRYGLEQFLREGRALGIFDHEHIVRVRDLFEENGTAYLVMDHYSGLTLAEYLRRKVKLSEQAALDILLPILDGLKGIHGRGVLHRDIKPQNIRLSARGEPLLLNFCSVRADLDGRGEDISERLTPGYAPIEQYFRKEEQGPWTDVYACAAVLYQMVTGEVPPEAPRRMAEDGLKPPRELAPSLSVGVAQALANGLATSAQRRYRSIQEFQDALLGQIVMGPRSAAPQAQPATALPAAPIPKLRRKKRRWPTALAVALILSGGGLWGWLRYYFQESEPVPVPAPAPASAERLPELPAAASAVKPGESLQACPHCPVMAAIPGGTFWMGSEDGDPERGKDEGPRHQVAVAAFKIGKYEVTQGQWRAVMGANPSQFQQCGEDCPVENVSFDEVQAFIRKLNAETGQRYRLPTEAEWEYAARAGTTTPFWTGNCVNTDQANYDGSYDYKGCGAKTGLYRKATARVGSFPPNPLGLHDTMGNVWEWTCTAYAEGGYDPSGSEQACAADADARRSVRGGAWLNDPVGMRSANRAKFAPTYRYNNLGFRLAQD
jgi:formylglycine-generating enzyme required for sulfatase activity